MSTGLECEFIEPQPGRWFYVLEDWSSPKGAWDWREYASAYGPFASQESARDHLQRHHANPGGWRVSNHQNFRLDDVYARLIKERRLA